MIDSGALLCFASCVLRNCCNECNRSRRNGENPYSDFYFGSLSLQMYFLAVLYEYFIKRSNYV